MVPAAESVAWFNRFLGYIRRGARDGRTESSDASYRSTGAGIQPLTVDELKEARRRLIRRGVGSTFKLGGP